MSVGDNKRIAKNTLLLYFRMFLIMGVSFFTFRLLEALGEVDYGIYNVVCGVVVLFAFLNNAMSQSCQRFFSYYIGNGDKSSLQKMFSASIWVHLFIAILSFFLAETIGLWMLNNLMNFPPDSMTSVQIVYQTSIVVFIIQILIIPYHASIISHESMSFYAYLSIVEAILKMSVVLILFTFHQNRLVIYSFSIVIVTIIIGLFYRFYCRNKFEVCRTSISFDKNSIKEISSFSFWNMLGGVGTVASSQGVNILFNIFLGVILNAAVGVANQVSSAVSAFVTNFQTAFNPQIIKLYSKRDFSDCYSLIFRASRFSFGLIFVIGFPIILLAEPILNLWLTVVPEYAVQFTQWIIIFCIIEAISCPLWTAAQASGRVKNYMIIISILIISNVLAAFLILYFAYSPILVFVYKAAISFVIHIYRILYLGYVVSFPGFQYIKKVMIPIFLMILLSIPIPLVVYKELAHNGLIEIISVLFMTIIISLCMCYYILLTKTERSTLLNRIKRFKI